MKGILAALAISALPGKNAELHGHVTLLRGHAAAHAIVYLEGGERAKPLENALVDQRNRTFIPHISVVTAGTVVRFPNNDTIYHNVFADYDAKKFDFGMYPRGATKTQRFDKPGLVVLMCSVHPDMGAYIMVVDTPYYAIADGQGRFAIHNVPGGTYTMKVWHESGQTESKTIFVHGDCEIDAQTHRGGG